MVCPLRLDAAALWALVDDLTRLQLQALHVLFGCIALRNRTLRRMEDGQRQMLSVVNVKINALCHYGSEKLGCVYAEIINCFYISRLKHSLCTHCSNNYLSL